MQSEEAEGKARKQKAKRGANKQKQGSGHTQAQTAFDCLRKLRGSDEIKDLSTTRATDAF